MIKNTYIFNPVRPDFIQRALDTLYKYTYMDDSRVVVIDQTLDGLKLDPRQVHLVIRPYRNLGFSKSMNEGIIHAMHWGSQYITCTNDDIEYIDDRWWDGILETFDKYERVMAVNPECPRIPLWGYGRPHGEYVDLLPYQDVYDPIQYSWLLEGDFARIKKEQGLPATFPEHKSGVTDAIATWHTTFKREFFEKIGLWEERFYPGGAEDYDLNARAYRENYRMLGTTKSWIWHWWGQSKDVTQGAGLPVVDKLRWANTDQLYPPELNDGQRMDPWGKWTDENGEKHPMARDSRIGIVDI